MYSNIRYSMKVWQVYPPQSWCWGRLKQGLSLYDRGFPLCSSSFIHFSVSLFLFFSSYLGLISERFHSLSCFTQRAMKAVSLRCNKANSHGGRKAALKERIMDLRAVTFSEFRGNDLPPQEKWHECVCVFRWALVWRLERLSCWSVFEQDIEGPAAHRKSSTGSKCQLCFKISAVCDVLWLWIFVQGSVQIEQK